MLKKLSETLYQKASPWWAILFLILSLGVFPLLFKISGNHLDNLSSVPEKIIDVSMGISPKQILAKLPHWGEEGRKHYALAELTLDTVYPLVYGLCYMLVISLMFRKSILRERYPWINIIPLGMVVFDYLENLSIVGLLYGYPTTPTILLWSCAIGNALKWLVGFAMIVVVTVRAAKNVVSTP